jgi:hypothetical protein
MSNIEPRHRPALVIRYMAFVILVVPALSGCRQSVSTIHGKVTYEGAPIQKGEITFSPADRRGVARSGKIEAGNYVVENVPPGKKTVEIIGVKQIHFAKTHGEMAEAAKKGPPKAPETADEVPADAIGNGQTVDTTEGIQERNFDLKRPKHG